MAPGLWPTKALPHESESGSLWSLQCHYHYSKMCRFESDAKRFIYLQNHTKFIVLTKQLRLSVTRKRYLNLVVSPLQLSFFLTATLRLGGLSRLGNYEPRIPKMCVRNDRWDDAMLGKRMELFPYHVRTIQWSIVMGSGCVRSIVA